MPNLTWLYVGLLYAGAVCLFRRYERALRWSAAAAFYVLVLAFLFRPMTGRWIDVPMDTLELVAPWSTGSHVTKFTVDNPMLPDVPLQMVPFAHEVRQAWRSGRLPLWQDLTACGGPLLGNGQSAALSPLRLLALPLPLGQAMTAEAALKILTALTFTYLYCRRRRFGEAAALVAAVSFGFSLFVVVWLHFSITMVAALAPAIFYGLELLAERQTARRMAFAALAGGAAVLGGHIETAAHVAFLCILYVVWIAIAERRGLRFAGAALAAGAGAAVLASPLLVALGETIVRSQRYQQLHGAGYAGIPFSDFPSLLASVLQPRFFGATARQMSLIPSPPAHAESISGFAGVLGVVGCVAALIAAPRHFRRRETFYALAWLLVLAILADFAFAGRAASAIIPFTAHARFRVALCWLTAVLAGFLVDRWGADAVTGDAAAVDAPGPPLPLIAGVAAVAAILAYALRAYPGPGRLGTTLPAFAVLALALLLPTRRRLIVPLLVIAVIAELWIPGYRWNPVQRPETMYPRTQMIERLQRLDRDGERFVGLGAQLFPNTNAMFGLPDIRHNDPTVNAAYLRALVAGARFDSRPYYAKWSDSDTALLDFLNVRWVVTEPGTPLARPRYALRYDGAEGRIYENLHVMPRFFSPHARVEVRSARPTSYRLEVDAPHDTIIVGSVPAWPGWGAAIAGVPLREVRVSGAFLGFAVPAGRSTILVEYVPLHIYAALAASVIAAGVLLFVAVRYHGRTHAPLPSL